MYAETVIMILTTKIGMVAQVMHDPVPRGGVQATKCLHGDLTRCEETSHTVDNEWWRAIDLFAVANTVVVFVYIRMQRSSAENRRAYNDKCYKLF